MNKAKIDELAARLQEVDTLSNRERTALFRDLENYARVDLYGAARLCKDHLRGQEFRPPAVILAADRIGKHFEERMQEPRRPVDLHWEQDKQLRQPSDGQRYEGPVVGTTPNCVIQRDNETGDLIVHARRSLVTAFEANATDRPLAINYPFRAIGGVGLVSEPETQREAGLGHQFAHQAARAERHASLDYHR